MELKVKNLKKFYGSHEILKGLSFEAKEGEFVTLVGPSGCGKTTTLRCIAGLERPHHEADSFIRLDQETLSDASRFIKPERRGFGMVFQSYAVWPHMNVFDNVAFPLRVGGKSNNSAIKDSVHRALKLVRLGGFADRFGHQLSGGQQQRVAIARALAMRPRLLLLDEPLSNLDVLLREELRSEIQSIQRQLGMTTILVTHDQKEALSLSHKIIVLNQGRIEAMGTPESLYSNPPTQFVAEFLGGGQTVNEASGAVKTYLPRRWRIDSRKSIDARELKIIAQLYLGNEYEYVGLLGEKSPIKFFSSQSYSVGSKVYGHYQD